MRLARALTTLARLALPACLLSVCSLWACSGAPSGGGSSPVGQGTSDEAFTAWSLPGVTLHRSCEHADDEGSCGVWGNDQASGERLDGPTLFRRMPAEMSASELARRAQDLLLGAAGEEPLTADTATSRFISAEERGLITAPRLEGGTLVLFTLEGEMHPTAMEIRIDRESGAVSRRSLIEVWVETAPATEGPLCMPVTTCGCDAGCAVVDRVAQPGGSDRFRRLDGQTPRVLYRVESSGALAPLNEACGEACPPVPPSHACDGSAGGCVSVPLAAPASPAPTR